MASKTGTRNEFVIFTKDIDVVIKVVYFLVIVAAVCANLFVLHFCTKRKCKKQSRGNVFKLYLAHACVAHILEVIGILPYVFPSAPSSTMYHDPKKSCSAVGCVDSSVYQTPSAGSKIQWTGYASGVRNCLSSIRFTGFYFASLAFACPFLSPLSALCWL